MEVSRRAFLTSGTLASLNLLACGKKSDSQPDKSRTGGAERLESIHAKRIDPRERPNVLWIVNDTSRAQNYSCYGYARRTSPNIDFLAERGVLFDRAYSQAFWTRPSVDSFMTGRYFPCPVGDVFRQDKGGGEVVYLRLPADEVLAPVAFADNGYATLMVTANLAYVSTRCRLAKAFQTAVNANPYEWGRGLKTDKPSFASINDEVFSFFETADPSVPFFVYLHGVETHTPYIVPPKAPFNQWINEGYRSEHIGAFSPKFPSTKQVEVTQEDISHITGLYDGCIRHADHYIGQLLDSLEDRGVLENTVVVFSSDHGEQLFEDGKTHGHTPGFGGPDTTHHIPLVMAGPGISEGLRVPDIVSSIDILPTLLHLCGLDIHGTMDGANIAGLFERNRDSQDATARTGRFAMTRREKQPREVVLIGETHKFEWNLIDHTEQLWAIPDRAGARRDELSEQPQLRETMRSYVERTLLPLENVYEKEIASAAARHFLTKRAWAEYVLGKDIESRVYVIDNDSEIPTDNDKWRLILRSDVDPHIMCPPCETPPVLNMIVRRVNFKGPCRVWVEAYATPSERGSEALAEIILSDGTKKAVFETFSKATSEPKWCFVDCGTVLARFMRLTAPVDTVARVRSVIFFPADVPGGERVVESEMLSTTSEDMEEHLQALEALGYL